MMNQHLIDQVYQAFNTRDIDGVLEFFHPTVHWPNGWEGGYVNGHAEVRKYWQRQWQEIDPTVIPVAVQEKPSGQLEVSVHQIIKDLTGQILTDGLVKHLYTIEDGKIERMEIEKA
ncbi:nuclear transport factor 2 family protein [Spirosoma validum]|uniref:Nuclear transport factor 2 family protein n=1 Tax=Spirosoma validum TaxID=2771355 RepID=A0A927GG69_9BACT|nr:nuclear transport factor 2 family protein [Spirosoma validum]MBD2756398.1 nuclear transport factor 2 family protein [Spirosoma validum]